MIPSKIINRMGTRKHTPIFSRIPNTTVVVVFGAWVCRLFLTIVNLLPVTIRIGLIIAKSTKKSIYYCKKCLFLQKITILNKNPKYNVLVILRVGVSDSIWQAREGLFPHCFDILFRCEAYHLVHRCSILE